MALTINDLKVSVPAHVDAKSKLCSPALMSFVIGESDMVAQFNTSSVGSRNNWWQTVQIFNWAAIPELVTLREEKPNPQLFEVLYEVPEISDLLNVHMHCNCPAYLYYGSQYQLTQYDTALYPESIFPSVRDPGLQNTVCKHIAAVLNEFFVAGVKVVREPEPVPEPQAPPQQVSPPADKSGPQPLPHTHTNEPAEYSYTTDVDPWDEGGTTWTK